MAEVLQYKLDMDKRSRWQIATVHPAAKTDLIYVQEVGDFYSGRNYYTVREGLDSFLIKLTLSGGGILEYEGKKHTLSAGQFFLIDCRHPQRYYTDPKVGHWHVLWVHFRGANAMAYYELFRTVNKGNPVGVMSTDGVGEELLQGLIARYDRSDSTLDNDVAASAALTQLMSCCISAALPQEQNGRMPEFVQRIRSYLIEHYDENIQLEMLSQQFSVSKYHLQRLFKKYIGQSPLQFLSGVRLTRAKQLLCTTDLPITEIAYRVGMENTSYFISKFKAQEKITPNQYRKQRSNR